MKLFEFFNNTLVIQLIVLPLKKKIKIVVFF